MKSSRNISGLTLFEMVLAVSVMAILVGIFIGVGSHTLTQAKTRLAESTISILVTALEQYHDFTGTFPPECDDLDSLQDALAGDVDGPGEPKDEFHSSEALYYYLGRVPESRKIISAISDSLKTNLDENEENQEVDRNLEFDPDQGDPFALIRFIDPWSKSFRYKYDEGDNFPKIISAGPDKNFETGDDIASKGI
jgi:type II secretory pathway pseudopilin PulG